MAKGSVRKKGKKWYYRFYVEDASGKMVQKEYAGTESKSETEKLLRKALEDYEDKKFVAKADNLTVGELLDMWAEEELKTGTLSNGTVENYLSAIRCTKKHPIADRKLKTVTAEHLQAFLDLLTFGGEFPDGKVRKGYSKDYIHSFSSVLQQSFRFAVFPKQLISFNPSNKFIRSYKFTFWFQLIGVLAGFIVPSVVLLVIFKEFIYCAFGATIGIFWMCVWMLLSMVIPPTRIYRKFAKWYRKSDVSIRDLDEIFY